MILAVDPGPHTGLVWRLDDGTFQARTLDLTLVDQPHLSLWQWMLTALQPGDEVVLESFEFRKNERDREYIDYKAGEYVGVVQLFCQLNCLPCLMQNAATGKGFWTDDKLKRAGLYKVCDSRHTRDAMRHWLKYWTFNLDNSEFLAALK